MRNWLISYQLVDDGIEEVVVSAANRLAACLIFEDLVRENDWQVTGDFFCGLIRED